MMSSNRHSKLIGVPRSLHFWLVVVLLVGLGVLHYIEEIGLLGVSPSMHFGLERHAMDRILFLLPIVYTIIVFGVTAGLATSAVVLVLMLPRAIIWSPNPRDAFFEIGSVILIALVVCLWFRSRVRAEEQRQRAAAEMDRFQTELQSHIQISKSNQIRLTLLNAISNMLSHSFDVKSLLRRALDMVMDVVDVEIALMYSLDERSGDLVLIAYDGVSDKFVEEVNCMKVGEGFNGLVAHKGEPLVVEDASLDPRLTKEVVREERIQAQLIVPLKTKGRIIGTLCVGNRRPRQYVPQEIEILTAIGNQIAIAIENGRLYEEQQVTAAQYRSIFEFASEAIWVEGIDGNIVAANEATAKLTGYSRDELLSMKTTSFLYRDEPKDWQNRHSLLARSLSNKSYDRRLIRRDGIELLVSLTSSSIGIDGSQVTFQHIARDVTRERQAEDNLRFYIEEITKAQEEERKRIARELHDDTAQHLIALSHQLEDFSHNNERLTHSDQELVGRWRLQLKGALQGVRQFTRDLRPPMLDDLGLIPALEWLTGELERTTKISTELKVIGPEQRFSAEVELLLFRIVQEALANVRRHAKASSVVVSLELAEGNTMVSIRDNGTGFALPKGLGDLSHRGKLGLIGMEERTRLLRGTLGIESEPGKGTTVTVLIPVAHSAGS